LRRREFADVFLVRHFAIRREAIEDRRESAFSRLGLEHGRQQQAEIKVSRPK
jgi:hypothetical protein